MLALRKPGPEPGELALQEVARPEPSPGQVVVQVHGAGICGTDLHIMEGEYPSEPPVTLGHEVAGVVVRAGTADSPWVGARVGVESFFSTDDTCPMCRAGRRNLCPERRSIGSFEDGGSRRRSWCPSGTSTGCPTRWISTPPRSWSRWAAW